MTRGDDAYGHRQGDLRDGTTTVHLLDMNFDDVAMLSTTCAPRSRTSLLNSVPARETWTDDGVVEIPIDGGTS